MAWLQGLPAVIQELQGRWSLALDEPFTRDASCAWVAPAMQQDGTRVVLKIAMPHMEGAHEIEGLRFWNGDPTVRLLDADAALRAMLLERCDSGTPLSELPEIEQDPIMARLLRRLWRKPPASYGFRPLPDLIEHWIAESMALASGWIDAGLVRAGLKAFEELSRGSSEGVLLGTDVHAGNVLQARREPWLVIDPKPFVGERAYDATQHLFNCRQRMLADPMSTIRRFADLLDVDHERVRLWMFARAAAEPRDRWDDDLATLARLLG